MSSDKSGVKAHDDVVSAAEGVRPTAIAAATTQSAVNVATITFMRAVVTSALKNNVSPAAAMSALRELGQTGV
jgi:hypothetical protein